ncbi:MAG: glycosyltransferase [Verrucomicrobiae bacterium]|nr:glycosyltransferase [Verrucomicrobiae bacterium]
MGPETDNPKKPPLLVLCRYERGGASSRLRFFNPLQRNPAVRFSGLIKPFFMETYLRWRHRHQPLAFFLYLHCLVRRMVFLVCLKNRPNAWIEIELLPGLPFWIENLFLTHCLGKVLLDLDDGFHSRYRSPLPLRLLLGNKMEKLMARVDGVTVGNDFLQSFARGCGAREVRLLRTPVDTTRLTPGPRSPRDRVVIGWIGSPSTAPYLRMLAPVLRPLSEHHGLVFHIMGSGPIDFDVGLKPEFFEWSVADECGFLQQLDIGIAPQEPTEWARGKSFYKISQYMAAGIPVVASDNEVSRSLVDAGENGFLARTTGEWIIALETLINDAALRQRMGRANRIRAVDDFSLESRSADFRQILSSLS